MSDNDNFGLCSWLSDKYIKKCSNEPFMLVFVFLATLHDFLWLMYNSMNYNIKLIIFELSSLFVISEDFSKLLFII